MDQIFVGSGSSKWSKYRWVLAVQSGPNIGGYWQLQVVQIQVGSDSSKYAKYRWVLVVQSGPNIGGYWQFKVVQI